ncbi:hypothetical protein [Trichormus sp. NMC-1]|uniref:hypothetical protein n=1 Tax=Trichormus sp. NMC-1 TaxID=1853259 RepID=UPI000A6B7EF7|nr:hypothetical protein [Trichormus sp. NMC-1]
MLGNCVRIQESGVRSQEKERRMKNIFSSVPCYQTFCILNPYEIVYQKISCHYHQ